MREEEEVVKGSWGEGWGRKWSGGGSGVSNGQKRRKDETGRGDGDSGRDCGGKEGWREKGGKDN
ncbi:uncharacterized protein DS421_12g368710 [Arachis hypogaea]|nr:uncharacterized protein DS421_12g368710 [Arachis hypogaea]